MCTETQERITTAWHEAGHVVIGMKLGLKLNYATIVPERLDQKSGFHGRTEWEPVGGALDVAPIIASALAGGVVEERLHGKPPAEIGLLDDKANIWAFVWAYKISANGFTVDAGVLPKLASAYRNRPSCVPAEVRHIAKEMTDEIGAEVKSILSERETWEQVETVAELLLKNKKVTPEMLRVTGS
jgi:hypothetical protein